MTQPSVDRLIQVVDGELSLEVGANVPSLTTGELAITGQGVMAFGGSSSAFFNINDYADLGACLNDVRATVGWGRNRYYNVLPGSYTISTSVDWSAQGSASAVDGAKVDLTGVYIDPDVGSGVLFDRTGTRRMEIFGGEVRKEAGSGCGVTVLDARNSNGARPRQNTWYAPRFTGTGATTAVWYNVGGPRMMWVSPRFDTSSGDPVCLYGEDNQDAITSAYDTIDDTPPDAVQNTLLNPTFRDGGSARALLRVGASTGHLTLVGDSHFSSNQDNVTAIDFVNANRTKQIHLGESLIAENFGAGYAPVIRLTGAGSVDYVSFGNLVANPNGANSEGVQIYNAAGTRPEGWRIGRVENGPLFGGGGAGRFVNFTVDDVYQLRGATLAESGANWVQGIFLAGFDVPNLTIAAGTSPVQGFYQDTHYLNANGARIEYDGAGEVQVVDDAGNSTTIS